MLHFILHMDSRLKLFQWLLFGYLCWINYGRVLRRAIDKKVRVLREMLSADEDITTALDKVVCRLMKLALRSSKGQQSPPPARWMQCKLLDLLTLTEKSISRRKKLYYDMLPMKAIEFAKEASQYMTLAKVKRDDLDVNKFVNDYSHVVDVHGDDIRCKSYHYRENEKTIITNNEEDLEFVRYTVYKQSSFATFEASKDAYRKSKINQRPKTTDCHFARARKRSHSKVYADYIQDETSSKKSKTKITRPMNRKRSISNSFISENNKKNTNEYQKIYEMKSKRISREYKKLHPTASKPIPSSIIELCHPELGIANPKDLNYSLNEVNTKERTGNLTVANAMALKKERVLIDIVMDRTEESFVLHKTKDTDLKENVTHQEESILRNISSKLEKEDSTQQQANLENGDSKTIFLLDINEPTTSKGIRHCSMDVQCGTDTNPFSQLLTPPASVTRISKAFSNGIKIDSLTNVTSKINSADVESPDNINPKLSKEMPNKIYSMGIKIGDSEGNVNAEKTVLVDSNLTEKKYEGSDNQTPSSKVDNPLTPVSTKTFSDFGTSTQETEQTMELSSKAGRSPSPQPETSRSKSPTKYTIGIKFKKSVSDTQSKLKTREVTPESSPERELNMRIENSLSNLLLNFEYSSFQSQSVTPRSISPDIRVRERKDQKQSVNTKTDLNFGTKLPEDKEKHPQSPILYTRVKMIDLVNDVTIEQDIEATSLPPSTSCKIVKPKNYRTISPDFEGKIKNSICLNTFYDTAETSTSTANVDYRRDLVEVGVPSEIDYKYSKFMEKIEPKSSHDQKSLNESSCENNKESSKPGSPLCKHFGFKIKDKNEDLVKKVEYAYTHVELLSEGLLPEPLVTAKTPKLVASGMKTEDMPSKSYGSFTTSSITGASVDAGDSKISKDINELPRKDINEQENILTCDKAPRILTCAGLHIHSYKEKISLEDVVFQGEWKRQMPKVQRKTPQYNTVVAKKVPEPKKTKNKNINNKEIPSYKKFQNKVEIKVESKKTRQVRSAKPIRAKQEAINKAEQIRKVALPNLARAIRANNKALTKVASKIMTNSITSKNTRSLRSTKKVTSTPLSAPVKNPRTKYVPEKVHILDLDSKYLPPYLKKKKIRSEQKKLEFDSKARTEIHSNKFDTNDMIPVMPTNKTKDLLKVQDYPHYVNYTVFRNELENSSETASNSQSVDTNKTDLSKRRRSAHKRSSSPISQNSSTCSIAESTATVKANSNWTKQCNRKQLISSNKSSTGNTDSDTSPSARNKKFVKRCKTKKSDGKESSNKENIPETTTINQNKECMQNVKSAFMGRNKNALDNMLARNSKHQTNFKIPVINSNEDKKRFKIGNNLKKKSGIEETTPQSSSHSEPSNIVLLVERKSIKDQEGVKIVENVSPRVKAEDPANVGNIVNANLLAEWLESGSGNSREKENTENAILAAMRQLVEERLNFIGTSLKLDDNHDIDESSLKNFKTVIAMEHSNTDETLRSEIENVMNHSLDAVLGEMSDRSILGERREERNDSDASDLISFKSITSASRYSDFLLAESNINPDNISKKPENSVLDLFERKDLDKTLIQNPPGNLAFQAFSGFSMNANGVVGDQIDFVPTADSESDSLVLDVVRQTTSEELFVSGRSSETYESCVVEEEIAVPDWLFRVMNPHLVIPVRQRPDPVNVIDSETGSVAQGYEAIIAEGDEEQQELLPLPMPLVEPVFDVNGNVLEPGIGLGAGAGDGRGMHSDHSQDSSGHGSSLSSSDASSEQQSESILMDPAAFATQFELYHEPVGSSMAVTTLVIPVESPEHRQAARSENEALSSSHDVVRDTRHLLISDGEADISSIDTDAHDSS